MAEVHKGLLCLSLLLCSLQQKLQLELGPQQVACSTSSSTSTSTSSNSTGSSSSSSSSGQPSTASAEQGQQQQNQQQQQRLHKGLPLPVFLPDAELDQLVQPLARWVCLLSL
jgi:hypothetical protein